MTSLHLINITESSRISLPDDMQRVSKATGCTTSRAHGEMKVKCSGQVGLVFRALSVVLGFLQYKNFQETESVSVVRWKRGEKIDSARPVLRHTIIVVCCFLLGYWVAPEGDRCLKFGDSVVVE